MTPIQFIRTEVFKAKQSEFAEIAQVAQATVSRWENGGSPSLDEMRNIRETAFRRGLAWSDTWFFVVPSQVAA